MMIPKTYNSNTTNILKTQGFFLKTNISLNITFITKIHCRNWLPKRRQIQIQEKGSWISKSGSIHTRDVINKRLSSSCFSRCWRIYWQGAKIICTLEYCHELPAYSSHFVCKWKILNKCSRSENVFILPTFSKLNFDKITRSRGIE